MWFNPVQFNKSETPTLANLANLRISESDHAQKPVEIRKFAEFADTPSSKTEVSSVWWLLHFVDDEPREVWTSPPATNDEILKRHPDAIAAEPLHQAAPEPARACSTCAHVTGRGACGDPVAAGLSAEDGVIRYHDDDGATCPAWLATIPPDLEARILAMAERWNYSGDDLALALDGARNDPDGWLVIVETNERRQ